MEVAGPLGTPLGLSNQSILKEISHVCSLEHT